MMLTKSEALEILSKKLLEQSGPEKPWVIVDKETIERPFGWVFFYQSKKFLETGIFSYRLAGNGPVVIDRITGAVEFHGPLVNLEQLIKEHEDKFARKTI
jgi:hypothetical protein